MSETDIKETLIFILESIEKLADHGLNEKFVDWTELEEISQEAQSIAYGLVDDSDE